PGPHIGHRLAPPAARARRAGTQRPRGPCRARGPENDSHRARPRTVPEPAANPGCRRRAMKRVPFFDNPLLGAQLPSWRARLALPLLFGCIAVLAGRALYLQRLSTESPQQQGERRYERTLTLAATRGKILGRNGVVPASSVAARGMWAIPEYV